MPHAVTVQLSSDPNGASRRGNKEAVGDPGRGGLVVRKPGRRGLKSDPDDFASSRMPVIRTSDGNKSWRGRRRPRDPHALLARTVNGAAALGDSRALSQLNPTTPFLGGHPGGAETCPHSLIYRNRKVGAAQVSVNGQTGERMWSLHAVEYYSATKRRE